MLKKTLHVETAGTLPTLIDESEKYQITDLTLTGNLNGTDIRYIREMAGQDIAEEETDGKLSILNLAEVNIVNGGDCYYGNCDYKEYFTEKDIISDFMFYNCTGLTSISIPNSITSIGESAFDGTGLTSIIIPNRVTSIGGFAFACCTGLTSVTIPDSITSIGYSAFLRCTGLTSITIPNSVTLIEDGAFGNCSGLTSITIPTSITSIGENAFAHCTELTSVTISDSVTSIGNGAFWRCVKLKEFIVSGQRTEYLFNKDKTTLILCPNAKSETYATIPNSVTRIECVDNNYNKLKSITEIGRDVVADYPNLDMDSLASIECAVEEDLPF